LSVLQGRPTGPGEVDAANEQQVGPSSGNVRTPTAVELIERERVYDGFFALERLRLRHERFAGGWTDVLRREWLIQRRAAAILPFDPARSTVLLVEQFRAGALDGPGGPWIIEAPAGLMEAGENAEALARRELLEECGLEAGRLEHALDYWASPGATSEMVHVFIGEVVLPMEVGVHGLAQEGEDIKSHVLDLDTAFEWLDRGRVQGASGLVALQWLRVHHARLRVSWQG
jgi:ADP-ribose pyrophosphatase